MPAASRLVSTPSPKLPKSLGQLTSRHGLITVWSHTELLHKCACKVTLSETPPRASNIDQPHTAFEKRLSWTNSLLHEVSVLHKSER